MLVDSEVVLDVTALRAQFPALAQQVRGKPLAYLDNAATTQKPHQVIEAVARYYQRDNANVHRGVHELSQRATRLYDEARATVAEFLGASRPEEIVFLRGCTEAMNLLAHTLGSRLKPGDEIVLSELEHHSNIVPWQMACERTGAVIRVAPIRDDGTLDLDAYRGLLSERTRVVSILHVSNALGTINPVRSIAAAAHEVGALVVVDGAQSAPHLRIDVRELGVDFYAFSGHKVYGPTGIGALYGRYELLEGLPPFQGGGDMIARVSYSGTTYAKPPARFEAGTPNIAGAVGLAEAIRFVREVGLERIRAWEDRLTELAHQALADVPGLTIHGPKPGAKAGVVSFSLRGAHPHDIGTILDMQGVAIRAGHHCAQPLMERLGVPATARASFGMYNTPEEVQSLVRGLAEVRRVLGL
ncbi:MAG: cysteine desulfurase [Fimbriimonadales bacterium]|nr:cysteine desulfurase [Fimbriimonadales bacterium]